MTSASPAPFARWIVCATAAVLAESLFGAAASDPPQVLPQVKVGAGIPLVKIAEYQMLEPRQAPTAVARDRFIYIAGGLISDGTVSNTVERFNVQTRKSEIFAHLRTGRMWHQAVIVGEKMYVLGGAAPGGIRPGYLTLLADSITAGHRTNSVVLPPDPVGGLDLVSSVEIVDLTTGAVTRGPEMLEPRHQFACVQAGGQIYAIGGGHVYRDKYRFTNTVEILDVAKSEWRPGVPMPLPHTAEAAIVDGGFVIVAGGYNGMFATDRVDAFDLKAGTWRTIQPLCRSTSANSVVFLGNYLFLFGDYESPERLLAYNLKTRESETFTLGYTPARHNAAVVADGKIFVIGGRRDREAESLRSIQVFAPTKTAQPRI